MRDLTRWTAGLVGDREPAAPLLTSVTPAGRVELSGTTTANWVAKTANLLRDGIGSPERVGVLLPLGWQALCAVLGTVAAGATVVVARDAADLDGCDAAFVLAPDAGAALAAGVPDVLVVSRSPLGLPTDDPVPALATDLARELPVHADSWGGPYAGSVSIELDGAALAPVACEASRLLVTGDLAGRLPVCLGQLAGGGALVLAAPAGAAELAALAAAEAVSHAVTADGQLRSC